MKLNLGCGLDYKEGYINCDKSNLVKCDKIVDLEKPLPFEDNSVSEIICYHILEHINNYIPLSHELYRICKSGAIIKIKVPYFRGVGAFTDPTHVRFFTSRSFDYFDGKCNPWEVGLNKSIFKVNSKINYSTGRFIGYLNYFLNPIINFNRLIQGLYEKFLSGIFPSDEVIYELKVLK